MSGSGPPASVHHAQMALDGRGKDSDDLELEDPGLRGDGRVAGTGGSTFGPTGSGS